MFSSVSINTFFLPQVAAKLCLAALDAASHHLCL